MACRLCWLGLLLLTGPGCVTTSTSLFRPPWPMEEAHEPVTKVFALWDNRVRMALDPLHNGAPYPGLAGQLYLIGLNEACPIHAKGQVVVDLYDVTAANQPARPCGRCVIDPATLHALRKRGIVGDGYTLFVDWPDYRPEIAKVRVHLSFVPEHGTAIFADPTVITLRGDGPIPVQSQQVVPAQHRQPPAPAR